MNVKTNPAFAIVSIVKFWPWLAVLSLLMLMVWILRLGSEAPSEVEAVLMATQHPSSTNLSVSQETPTLVTIGKVDSEPVDNYLPAAQSEVSNQVQAHAGTASIFSRLMGWVSRLGSDTPPDPDTDLITTPHSSAITSSPIQHDIVQEAPIDNAVDAPVADGEVDPVPIVSHLPVGHGEVRNQDRVHAGDDSMFLKDEDTSAQTTTEPIE